MADSAGTDGLSQAGMKKQEFALKMYESASAHFLIRVRQRDAVLLFFVAAVGSIFGLTSEQGSLGKEFLLAIPYIGCACGVMMAYHSLFIEAIMKYCQNELLQHLGEISVFEASRTFASTGMWAVLLRSMAYVLLLLLPISSALWETRDLAENALWFAAFGMGSVGVACVFVADLMHILGVRRRIRRR